MLHNECNIYNSENFGVIYYDSISRVFSLYMLYLEIYVRLFVNLMRKKVLKILIESSTDRKDFDIFTKTFSCDFIQKTCTHAKSLVRYLNLSMSTEAFRHVFHNIKSLEYSCF